MELASEVGITKAKRQLGYPHSWATGKRWADSAGIEIPLDSIKAQAAAHNQWYTTEDLLFIAHTGLARAQDALENTVDLSPDDQKKLAEAVQKYTNTVRLLEEKATSITEKRDALPDIDVLNIFAKEESRNDFIEKKGDKSYQDLEVS